MSDNAPNTNRTVMLLLGVIVILLAALVIVVIMRQPAGTASTGTNTTASNTAASTAATTSQPGLASSTSAPFDPSTATKVPASMQPKDFVSGYYQDILDKKWNDAFDRQPAASKAGQSVADFQATEASYGMKSFKFVGQKVSDATATVVIQQDLGTNGIWGATWTLVKYNGGWVVQARAVQMGAPTAP